MHNKYRRYMDLDPLGRNRLLFVAGERVDGGDYRRVAVVINWRTGTELRKFPVPPDTHDVDALGGGKFAVADKANHTAYIVNASTGKKLWVYDFKRHFSVNTSGNDPISGDWTHLNDIDLHDNDSEVLLSPRNFDRVMMINRSTKNVSWTLGKQDNHSILYAQHNPDLLDRSPRTVLVADSENDRVVEYRYENSEWKLEWQYKGDLHWPRDADRLPNGNTLITDTFDDRVIEVTPNGKTVWEHEVSRNPYDAERLQYGDEPAGPSINTTDPPKTVGPNQHTSVVDKLVSPYVKSFDRAYQLFGAWIVPGWAGPLSFLGLLFGFAVALVWLFVGIVIRLPFTVSTDVREGRRYDPFVGVSLLSVSVVTIPLLAGLPHDTAIVATFAFVLFAAGLFVLSRTVGDRTTPSLKVLFAVKMLSLVAGLGLGVLLVGRAIVGFRSGSSHVLLLCAALSLLGVFLLSDTGPRISPVTRSRSSVLSEREDNSVWIHGETGCEERLI